MIPHVLLSHLATQTKLIPCYPAAHLQQTSLIIFLLTALCLGDLSLTSAARVSPTVTTHKIFFCKCKDKINFKKKFADGSVAVIFTPHFDMETSVLGSGLFVDLSDEP